MLGQNIIYIMIDLIHLKELEFEFQIEKYRSELFPTQYPNQHQNIHGIELLKKSSGDYLLSVYVNKNRNCLAI